jgi:hypothetical protein
MHFNKTALIFGLLVVAGPAMASNVELEPQPIPVDEVLPIEGLSCGCKVFPQNKMLSATNIIMSSGSYDGPHLLHLNGKTVSFTRKGRPSGNSTFINKYSAGQIQLVTSTRKVKYQKACVSYPDPPSEGSCWVGTLKLRTKGASSMTKIVEICGC